MSAVPDYASAAVELRLALEEAAEALAHADLERLLACEARIESALTQVPSRTNGAANSSITVTAEVQSARAALVRCRRLGLALHEFVRLGLSAQGIERGYGRAAAPVPQASPALHTINRTV